MTNQQIIDDLVAKEQVRQAMARYARGIDRLDQEMVKSAYHEDSYDDHGWGLTGPGWGLAEACGNGQLPKEWKVTSHFLGQHYITVDGDRAASEVYYVAHQTFDDADGVEWDWSSGGRYVDNWERRNGEFKISQRTVIYDYILCYPIKTLWPGPDHDVPKFFYGAEPVDISTNKFGVRGPDDLSYQLLS